MEKRNRKKKKKPVVIRTSFRPILPAGTPRSEFEYTRQEENPLNKTNCPVKELLEAKRRLLAVKKRANLNKMKEDMSETQETCSMLSPLDVRTHILEGMCVQVNPVPSNSIQVETSAVNNAVKMEPDVKEGEITVNMQNDINMYQQGNKSSQVTEGGFQPSDDVYQMRTNYMLEGEKGGSTMTSQKVIKNSRTVKDKVTVSNLTTVYLSKKTHRTADPALSTSESLSSCSDVPDSDPGLSDTLSFSQRNDTPTESSHAENNIFQKSENSILPNKKQIGALTEEKKSRKKKQAGVKDVNKVSAPQEKKTKHSERKEKPAKPPQPLNQAILKAHFVKGSYIYSGHCVDDEADIERLVAVDLINQVDNKGREAAKLSNQLRYRANDYKAYIYQNEWLSPVKSRQKTEIYFEPSNTEEQAAESDEETRAEKELLLEILSGVSNVVPEKRSIRHCMRNFYLKQKSQSCTNSNFDSQQNRHKTIAKDSPSQDSASSSSSDTEVYTNKEQNQQGKLQKDSDVVTVANDVATLTRNAFKTFSFTFNPNDDGDFDVNVDVSEPLPPVFPKGHQKTSSDITLDTDSELFSDSAANGKTISPPVSKDLDPDCSLDLQKTIKQEPPDTGEFETSPVLPLVMKEEPDEQLLAASTLGCGVPGKPNKNPFSPHLTTSGTLLNTVPVNKAQQNSSNVLNSKNGAGLFHRMVQDWSTSDITPDFGVEQGELHASLPSEIPSNIQVPVKTLIPVPNTFQTSFQKFLNSKIIKTEPKDSISGNSDVSDITIEPGPSHRENPLNKMLQQFADCIVENISINEETDLDIIGLLHDVDNGTEHSRSDAGTEVLQIEKQSCESDLVCPVSVKQEPQDSGFGELSSENGMTRRKRSKRNTKTAQNSNEPSASRKRSIHSSKKRTNNSQPQKPKQCYCGKSFSCAYEFTKHQRSHNLDKPWACPICGKCFARKDVMKRHNLTHEGGAEFKCNLCPKKFSHRYELNRHKRTHSGEKKFQCNICKVHLSQKSGLNRHLQTHFDEKPFTCNICKNKFVRKAVLYRHFSRRHKFIKVACPVCGIGFKSQSEQVAHLSSNHEIGVNQCPYCLAQFSGAHWLKKHDCNLLKL